MTGPRSSDDASRSSRRLLEALGLLRDAVTREKMGMARLDDAEVLELQIRLPLSGDLDAAVSELDGEVERALARASTLRHAIRPGRVFCLACSSVDCDHAFCPGSRHVFVGYHAHGTPAFEDLGQWLLDLGDPRVDLLYANEPGLLALPMRQATLEEALPAEIRRQRRPVAVLGQVVAGFFALPGPSGTRQKQALTFQLVRIGRKTRLHVVGAGDHGCSLEEATCSLDPIPWAEAARWVDGAAPTLGRGSRRARRGRGPSETERIEGMLASLARRLEKTQRGKKRRTRHAENHHARGRRPTRMAMADLARARDAEILFDDRHRTAVVLGDRGRTHFFNLQGRIVSSVRYSQEAIARKREKGIWRPASEQEILGLKGAGSREDSESGDVSC